MSQLKLSDIFSGIGAKRLSAVEVDHGVSNQHEFNGVSQFKELLGPDKKSFEASFIYLTDENEDEISDTGFLTWYDAREKNPERSEHRMYFSTNQVVENAFEGDLLIICKLASKSKLFVIIAKEGSNIENQLMWLFNLGEGNLESFYVQEFDDSRIQELDFAAKIILNNIDDDLLYEKENLTDLLISKYPAGFPSTKEFSALAHDLSKERISEVDDPDDALLTLWEQEVALFKALEKHLVEKVIKKGFEDVDTFIKYSLKVQNTRKSRAGRAFENHLEMIFRANKLKYSGNKVTENKSKPDFIFPGIEDYRNDSFKVSLLTMLGVKTTCKDRWRQVLAEAERIEDKHLATLEPAISDNQTEEMAAQKVTLVIPEAIHKTYSHEQQKNLLTIKDFINLVQKRQDACN